MAVNTTDPAIRDLAGSMYWTQYCLKILNSRTYVCFRLRASEVWHVGMIKIHRLSFPSLSRIQNIELPPRLWTRGGGLKTLMASISCM